MSDEPWTPVDLVKTTAAYFEKKGVPSARLDAEVLLAHVLGCKRLELYTGFERPLAAAEVDRYRELVRRRAAREPVSRILGQKEFMSLPFAVTGDVLAPRPETEILVEEAVRQLPDDAGSRDELEYVAPRVLDLCTGSGCIAVAVAVQRSAVQVVATDLHAPALLVARENAERNGVWQRIDFREGDLFAACWEGELFDMILCNPPYLVEGDGEIWPEVREYEPAIALYADAGGMEFYLRIAEEAPGFMARGGSILLEVGAGQAAEVIAILERADAFEDIRALPDHAGMDRVICARRRVFAPIAPDGEGEKSASRNGGGVVSEEGSN